MPLKKSFCFFLLFSVASIAAVAQPVWHAGTPAIGTVGPLSVGLNYGLDRAGKVYVIVFNSNVIAALTSNQVRTWAQAGPAGGRVVSVELDVTAGQINTTLNELFTLFDVNRAHAMYIVAEASGVLQATPVRLQFTTLPCPAIDILTGFSQPQTCISAGPMATFQVGIFDPPNSGVIRGTQWVLNWGDGTPPTTFISSVDYEVPPLAMRQHVYSSTGNCNYVFTVTITNPCGRSMTRSFVAAVHDRDIPAIVNNANGLPAVQVCEGTQTVVVLRDNSIWNCQNPVVPGGLTPVPNIDTRNIEWRYGIDPSGNITNTITGAVTIGSLGSAPQSTGRIVPSPYGAASLSNSITIPATAQAGETFRVWLKNWNKCNSADPSFVYTFIDIEVVAGPPPPVAPSRVLCVFDDKTLTVTSAPMGTLTWYSNAALTNIVGFGPTYTPAVALPGTYTWYVTDTELSGLLCQSQPTAVSLVINPKPNTPTIT